MDDLSGTFQDKAYFWVEQRTVFFFRREEGAEEVKLNYDPEQC